MNEEYIPPAECLRRAAESLEKAAEHHEDGDVDDRDNELNNALAWLEEGKYEGELGPLFAQGDLAKQLVDLPPQEIDQIRELYDEGTYSYKDLAKNFRCSVTAVQPVIEDQRITIHKHNYKSRYPSPVGGTRRGPIF